MDWIPNGAYPAGNDPSVNAPAGNVFSAKFWSKTSIALLWKSVAKRYRPAASAPPVGIVKSVRPLNTAPVAERSTPRNAWFEGLDPLLATPGFQPEMVPSSVAKMNIDE